MANLTITAANVALSATYKTAKIAVIRAGASITRGQAYYLDQTDNRKAKLALANDTAGKLADGIALTGASADGYFVGLISGYFTPGATLTKGVEYYLSRTAGAICPFADLTTGDGVIKLFRAISTTEAILDIEQTVAVL